MGGGSFDVRGGQRAIGCGGVGGGGEAHKGAQAFGGAGAGGRNDAVDFFFKAKGLQSLYTQLELSLSASELLDRDFLSKSDPMAVVYAKRRDGTLEELGRTEVIMNNLEPAWIQKISVNYHFEIVQPLVFHVYDVDTQYHNLPVKMLKLKDQDFLGEASCVLSEIVTKRNRTWTLNLHNPDGRGFKNLGTLTVQAEETVASRKDVEMTFRCCHQENKDAVEKVTQGQLFVERYVEKQLYSFLDYISTGFKLNFMVAVDFTASNGNPYNSDSLHHIDPSGNLNAYQQAIMEVGEVIQFYDSDRRFPAWGFGAKTLDGLVSHCFNLNGSPTDFEVTGVEGIMAAYATALYNVSLAGPILFGPVINKAAGIAAHSRMFNQNKYFILLIITDGVITDTQETKDALVRASDLPLSILIVGVGGADFQQMEILDADDGRRLESSTGRVAKRDIVQFVPMREVRGGQISVVQALLEELPGQFLTYMRSRDIKPHFPDVVQASAQGNPCGV